MNLNKTATFGDRMPPEHIIYERSMDLEGFGCSNETKAQQVEIDTDFCGNLVRDAIAKLDTKEPEILGLWDNSSLLINHSTQGLSLLEFYKMYKKPRNLMHS